MTVTLRKFLEIVGNDFVEPYCASLYVEGFDELFGKYSSKRIIDCIKHASKLEPYLDWEITACHQVINCGEIEEQNFYVRKIIDDSETANNAQVDQTETTKCLLCDSIKNSEIDIIQRSINHDLLKNLYR